jgi:hypothetical protein
MALAFLSPQIEHISWGKMEVEGLGTGRDFKLYPGGGEDWDWSKTNTHHQPGIQPQDVQDLVARGAQVIILTRGMELRLETAHETIHLLDELALTYHILETKEAVEFYNHLVRDGQAVGGLFHSTC